MAIRTQKHQLENDLGIGSQVTTPTRLLDKKGNFKVERRGTKSIFRHPYQMLLGMSWFRFHAVIVMFYLIINLLFALCYVAIGREALSGEYHGQFMANFFKAFFFSVQTMTTVGYGNTAPMCFTSNLIAAIEALFGLMVFALATGLYYAKFTRPEAKIKFSAVAVIAPYKDKINGFMFRIINESTTQLIDIEAQATFSWLQADSEGKLRRSYEVLQLERSKIAIFPLNWTIVHPIDDQSPFKGHSIEELHEMKVEIIVFVKAQDLTFGQMVQTNSSYLSTEILWGYKFIPMYYADEKNGTILEMDKIDHTKPMELHR